MIRAAVLAALTITMLLAATHAEDELHVTPERQQEFARAALTQRGDAENGRKLFLDQTRTRCAVCHRVGGPMLINDVGGSSEEINPGMAGANYGWPTLDHGLTDRAGYVGPLHVYPQASISGGDFAPPSLGEPLGGRYFFADFVHGWIHVLDPANPRKANTFATGLRRPVDLRFARDGSLCILLRNAWVIDGKFEGGTGSLLRVDRAKAEN